MSTRIPLDKIRIRDLVAYEAALDYVAQHPEADEDEEEVELSQDDRGVYWLDKGHRRFIRTQLGQTARAFRSCVADDSVLRFAHEEQHGTPYQSNALRRSNTRGTGRVDRRRDRRDRGAVDAGRDRSSYGRPQQHRDGRRRSAERPRLLGYAFVITTAAKKDIQYLDDPVIAKRIADRIRLIPNNPRAGAKKLKGRKNTYAAKEVPYRIVYFIHEKEKTVEFLAVWHRREAYRNLPKYRPLPHTSSYRSHDAGPQERELERLLQAVLVNTHFEGKVFAVGGYVRDELLGKEPADLDVVVELPYGAQRVAGHLLDLFPGVEVEPLALDYPVWHVRFPEALQHAGERYEVGGAELDLTDTQSVVWQNGHSSTEFGTRGEDAKRRDFTVNTLLKDLSSGEILDPTGVGRQDLERGVLRAIPDADKLVAFREQPRRMLRLIRFMAQYGWQPDEEEEAAMRASVQYLADISGHGLKKEFHKLQQKGLLDTALALMREFGMLPALRAAWRKAKQVDVQA